RCELLARRGTVFAGQVQRIGEDLPQCPPDLQLLKQGARNAPQARHVPCRSRQHGNRLRHAARSDETLSQSVARRGFQGRLRTKAAWLLTGPPAQPPWT